MPTRLRREDYTIGWVCALPIELAAAQEMLDEEHEPLDRDDNNENLYSLGSIGGHNVAIVCLPAGRIGNNPAAAIVTELKAIFRKIRFGLMVGIGGGVPSKEVDIRLGDVVVSQPRDTFGGVVQYDMGKRTPSGFIPTGSLNAPPQILLSAVSAIRANRLRGRSKLAQHISKVAQIPQFQRVNAGPDVLYESTYGHVGGSTCELCTATKQVFRQPRESGNIKVHYGTIASGNQVIRDGGERDKLKRELGGVLCFEMEAAGLMNNFPCLVIRGICDYADSHKNKTWQPYAAAMAAAYAKELLLMIPAADVAGSQTADEATKRSPTSAFYVPFPRNRRFVGRATELDTLKQKLLIDRDCQRLAIIGLGGIGKTQIALSFAYFIKDKFPEYSIFWLPALSLETFEQACEEIGKRLGIDQPRESSEDIKELVQQRLSAETTGKWLLIVDNADDMELLRGARRTKGLDEYLPYSDNGLVVFTTRSNDVAEYLVRSDVVEVGKMEKYEAVAFLSLLVRKDLIQEKVITSKLLEELDYLPLAMTQAAAYMNMKRVSSSEYLRLLKNTEQDMVNIMSTELYDNTRYKESANAVATTWIVSFNQVLEHDSVAANLLQFMSCIEWKAIPHSILPVVKPEARMVAAIGTLCSYSFIAKSENNKTYDMHRLVHLATRIWTDQTFCGTEVRKMAIQHCSDVFPSNDYTKREIWREYLPHVARMKKEEEGQGTEARIVLCLKAGQCLIVDGRIGEAIVWLQESFEWRKRNNTEVDPDRLLSQRELARAYQANGQVKEAVKLLEGVVAIEEKKVLAEDHPDRLVSQHALALVYQVNGQVKEAVKLLESVVAIQEKVLAEDHPSRLASQHELAMAYQANGQAERERKGPKHLAKLLEHVVAVK
ncbi:kinesin light chain [Aulographum hederae CBS 113979]|uniref:Kinesin light chain n=1 Tax=Aulographum hederae CBS 113979 TaxID=1176131 RepID=A0A6G1GT16_9PEZI|nr:kinesin light chain [Aulographum hederae CBS 113979]